MISLFEGLRIALMSIINNRMRAGLTMLGIIIGVAAVISLISLGRGVEQFVEDQFTEFGARMLIVSAKRPEAEERTRIEPLTTEDVDALLEPDVAPGIEQIAVQYNVVGTIADNGEGIRTSIRGVTPNYPDVRNWPLDNGNFFTQAAVDNFERVAIIGPDLLEDLYDDANYDPIGNVVRLNGQTFTVVGVMEARSDPFSNDNAAVLVPISTAQTRLGNALTRGGYEIHQMYVQAISNEATYAVEASIDAYFAAKRDIPVEMDDWKDYDIFNFAEQLEIAGTVTGLLTVFLGLIASVSLLVGGIGIMNIMLVTVTERTKEIGLRKAMGATPMNILIQFLLESIILSLIGGVIGIAIGWVFAYVGTNAVDSLTLSVDIDAVILATLVSSFVGIFFGIFPANRAARMTPIDALNFE